MAIAFDAASALQSGTTTFSWTHTPVGTPRGVVVILVQNSAVNAVSGVTYGGVAMTEVSGSPLLKSSGESGQVRAWHLGASVPTGAQTVEVTVATGTTQKRAASMTVTAAADTAVEDTSTLSSDSQADPSVDLSTGAGVETFIAAGLHSGHDSAASLAPGADYTQVGESDYGAQLASIIRRTAIATGGTIAVSWTQTAEDATLLAVAIKEAAGGDATATPAVIATTSTVPQPAVGAGAAPAVAATTTTVPQPAVSTGTAPAAAATTSTVPRPAVSGGAAPAAVATASTVPQPAVSAGAAPAAIATASTVPTPAFDQSITVEQTFEGADPVGDFDADSNGRLTVQAASALVGAMGLQFTPAASTSFVKWREQVWFGGVQFFPYWSARFYVRLRAHSGAIPPSIFTARTVAASDDFTFFYNLSTGTWKWDLDQGDNAVSGLVELDRWYLVEAKGSYAASPWTANVRIDGVDQASVATAGNPAEKLHEFSWGPQVTTQTWTADMDAFKAAVSTQPLPFLGPADVTPGASVDVAAPAVLAALGPGVDPAVVGSLLRPTAAVVGTVT